MPDATLQFETARTLAQAGGDPPYRGSSRVVEILLQAATSTGEEIAVVAHPDEVVREELATNLSRFGYRIEKVASGRDAILAARASVDTVLVVIAARTVRPTALETVQFIQRQATGDVPPVLVVVDPLDDDARGKFLTQLLLKFSDLDCVGIIDRLDSLFMPRIDLVTGKLIGPPRFPDHLAQVAGPQAVAPAARQARATQRRTRAAQSLALLADLGRRGWDVAAAETTARLALMQSPQPGSPTDLFGPAASLLGTIGSSRAQQALLGETERTDLPAESRKQALAAFAESVNRYGVLLECGPLRAAYARYNHSTASTDRAVAGAVLDVIVTPSGKARPVSADAAHPRPTRCRHQLPDQGSGPAMMEVYAMTRRVAASNASVLLVGETGTGKELVAKAIHQLSPRGSGPFVRVNCGALSESLLESELFGHVRGSFTGAIANRTGRFEAAHTGTIFLDEINSTTPKLQVKLLRVLQEREFERVGDTETIRVDTRVIAASNRELLDEVAKENFREDLYYRLNVVPIYLPPLRARREDIPQLVSHFLEHYNEANDRYVVHIQKEAAAALAKYHWPGNVRELQNVVERCVVMATGDELTLDLLPPAMTGDRPTVSLPGRGGDLDSLARDLVEQGMVTAGPDDENLFDRIVSRVERELIAQMLADCKGVQLKAAARLGINRNTLRKKLQEHGLEEAE